MTGSQGEEGFPAAVYRETVLAPLFEGVKQHHWRQQMRINRASAIMLAAQGLLTRTEAGAILQALDDIERGTDVPALAIFTFPGNWTALLWPLISTTDRSLYTLPVGLASFSGEFQTEWEMVMTGASTATLPMLLVFVALQRYIVRGVMLAGLKG